MDLGLFAWLFDCNFAFQGPSKDGESESSPATSPDRGVAQILPTFLGTWLRPSGGPWAGSLGASKGYFKGSRGRESDEQNPIIAGVASGWVDQPGRRLD